MNKLFATLPLLACIACVSASFAATNASPRPLQARPVAEVAVYTTVAPERPYVEVGIVSASTQPGSGVGRETLIQSVREKAAAQGCDGIIMASGSTILAEATCIVFK